MILQALVYTGQPDNLGGEGHAANVIKTRIDEKINSRDMLYMDMTVIILALQLLHANVYSTKSLQGLLKKFLK